MPRNHTAPEPPLPPRLAATLALIPLSVGVTVLSMFVIGSAELPAGVAIFLMFLAILLSYYVPAQWIWWGTVHWTRRRRWGVLLTNLAFGLTLAAAFVATVLEGRWSGPWSFLVLSILVTAGGAVALIIINVVCYSAPDSVANKTVPCPNCGHDLRGAGSCRCPVCNHEFTLGELARSYAVAQALGLTASEEVAARSDGPKP